MSDDGGHAAPGAPACPLCGGSFEPGTVVVRGSALGFLAVGLSLQHLRFRADGASKDEVVAVSNTPRSAHRCVRCGAVLVETGG